METDGNVFALKTHALLANELRVHIRELGIQGVHALITKQDYIYIPLQKQITTEQLETIKLLFLSQTRYSDLFIEQIELNSSEDLRINRTAFNNNIQSKNSSEITAQSESARRKRSRLRSEKQRAKHNRGIIFSDWLCDTFGTEFLRRGCGVLDVAGGKGDVAFQLGLMKQIACTVVDPTPIKLSKSKTRLLLERAKINVNYNRSNVSHFNSAKKTWFDADTVKNITEDLLIDTVEELHLMDQRQCLFNDDFVNHSDGIWKQTSVVVGVHPDEATELLVDAALQCGKPFAVVPCCVFPNSNTHRRTLDGQPVILYSHFIQYLMEKDPLIEMKTLEGLSGRNIVVYKR